MSPPQKHQQQKASPVKKVHGIPPFQHRAQREMLNLHTYPGSPRSNRTRTHQRQHLTERRPARADSSQPTMTTAAPTPTATRSNATITQVTERMAPIEEQPTIISPPQTVVNPSSHQRNAMSNRVPAVTTNQTTTELRDQPRNNERGPSTPLLPLHEETVIVRNIFPSTTVVMKIKIHMIVHGQNITLPREERIELFPRAEERELPPAAAAAAAQERNNGTTESNNEEQQLEQHMRLHQV
eukprot:scaffold244588_cov43-Attheya_sp.AAC.1